MTGQPLSPRAADLCVYATRWLRFDLGQLPNIETRGQALADQLIRASHPALILASRRRP